MRVPAFLDFLQTRVERLQGTGSVRGILAILSFGGLTAAVRLAERPEWAPVVSTARRTGRSSCTRRRGASRPRAIPSSR